MSETPAARPARWLDADTVLITGLALEALQYAVRVAQDARERNGIPRSKALDQLSSDTCPAQDISMDMGCKGEGVEEFCSEVGDWLSTVHVARMLGLTPRQTRRKAPLLGGRLIGQRMVYDRLSVLEHIEGLRLDNAEGRAA